MLYRDTSVAIKQAISQALNATGAQAVLSNKPLIDLYHILRYDLNQYVSTSVQLLYTVIKAEVCV